MGFIVSFDAFLYILLLLLFLEAIIIVLQYLLVDFEGIKKIKKELKAIQEKSKQEKDVQKKTELSKQMFMLTFSMMKYQKQYFIVSFVLFPLFFFLLKTSSFIKLVSSIFPFLNANAILPVVCTGCKEFVGGPVLSIFGINLGWFWTYLLMFMIISIIGSKLFLKY